MFDSAQSTGHTVWLSLTDYQVTMKNLISYLEQFADCYEGDPQGLASDFEIVAGISMNDLCQKLSDEIEAHKEMEREEMAAEQREEDSRLLQLQAADLL